MKLQGEQIFVEKDQKITVNRMKPHKAKTLKVDKILFGKKGNSYKVGTPYIKGAYVECEILGDKRSKKVISYKYRERKSSQSKKGHRQDLTELVVKDIHFE
jgi:large subunit ribosomal protein L21